MFFKDEQFDYPKLYSVLFLILINAFVLVEYKVTFTSFREYFIIHYRNYMLRDCLLIYFFKKIIIYLNPKKIIYTYYKYCKFIQISRINLKFNKNLWLTSYWKFIRGCGPETVFHRTKIKISLALKNKILNPAILQTKLKELMEMNTESLLYHNSKKKGISN